MSTTHYFCDEIGKNVIDVGNLDALDLDAIDFYHRAFTAADIEAARRTDPWENGHEANIDLLLRWQREVCDGRALRGYNEYQDCPWDNPKDPYQRPLPGWTMYLGMP